VTIIARGHRYYADYASPAVGAESDLALDGPADDDGSITIGAKQASLFHCITATRATAAVVDWDGEGGSPIVRETVNAAIHLLHALPVTLPPPEISPEPTGEIAFEWYKDRNHVVVLAVDGAYIRWSALTGPDKPMSGAEPFTKTVPAAALDAIGAIA